MSYPAKLDITLFIGIDFTLSFYMKTQDEVGVDLTDHDVKAYFRYHASDSEFVGFDTEIDVENSKITFSLTHENTYNLVESVGEYDVVLIYPDESRRIILKGCAIVKNPITRF